MFDDMLLVLIALIEAVRKKAVSEVNRTMSRVIRGTNLEMDSPLSAILKPGKATRRSVKQENF